MLIILLLNYIYNWYLYNHIFIWFFLLVLLSFNLKISGGSYFLFTAILMFFFWHFVYYSVNIQALAHLYDYYLFIF